MNTPLHNRRNFLKRTTMAGFMLTMRPTDKLVNGSAQEGKRIGIIGLDTSHSVAFTKVLNTAEANPTYMGYKVVAAYPYGSKDIESSTKRIPDYINDVKKLDVAIVDSIDELLKQVDVVLLETNDGRLHLEQAAQVLKVGKRVFIDKPIAASLNDVIAIFELSKTYKIPIFSASSLRYIKGMEGVDKSQ